MIELEGNYTDARILGVDEIEESCVEQIQRMIDHEALTNHITIIIGCNC